MYPVRPTHRPILTLAAAALALALTGCGAMAAQNGGGPAGPPSSTAAAASQPSSSAEGASQPSSSAQAPAPGAGEHAATAPAAELATFTFPGGRTSFDHPKDWTVDGFHSADAAVTTATATVKNADGRTMATVYVGAIGDVVAGNVERTVYETLPVPGLASLPAPQAHLSWYREDSSAYRLQLTSGPAAAGAETVGLIRTHEGVLSAEVVWDAPQPFASEEAAKAWYASDEGRQLRALLLSLRAS